MPNADIRDLNIRYVGHPKYNANRILEDRTVEYVVQKLENVLYTNKGDILGDPDFGANLEFYLWSTSVPVERLQAEITSQIDTYIPELNQMDYKLELELYEGTARDILIVNVTIKDVQVNFVLK